jgi:cytochrome c6
MIKHSLAAILSLMVIALVGSTSMNSVESAEKTGEQLFKEHCSVCHPEGSNIINSKKTLQKKDLEANNIKSTKDVINIMRKPGPGMTAFDMTSISDKDAQKIADYIFKKFKK